MLKALSPSWLLTPVDLARAFQTILDRAASRHDAGEWRVGTVGQMIEYLRRRLLFEDRPIRLKKILHNVHSRKALVCTFLAILELVAAAGYPASDKSALW